MTDTHLNTTTTLCQTEEENNIERGVGRSNCSYMSGQTRPNSFKKCKMNKMLKPTNMESLPVDVIFDILVRVPAQDIADATQLVCRKWYKIVHTRDFTHAHLQQSTSGLLAWDTINRKKCLVNFISSGKGLFDISKVNYRFTGHVYSSCNGLVLEGRNNDLDVCIINPITKQNYALPPFLTSPAPCGYAIAYAATSMEYKVVRVFFYNGFKLQSQDDIVAILTIGVDKEWACRVNTKHLSVTAKKLLLFSYPFTTEGFVHWANNDSRSEFVLTMNIETEIITQFLVPCCGGETQVTYLPMGSCLSLLILRSKFSWEFWEMKPETGEWTKMSSIIDLGSHFANDARNYVLTPVGWSRPREVFVFTVSKCPNRLCFAYNVRTRELQEFKVDGGTNYCLAHRNSLVWIDGD